MTRLGKLLGENLSTSLDPATTLSFRWTAVTPCAPDVFSRVLTSLTACQPLSFCYYSPHQNVCTTRAVEPHHMVNYQGA